MCHCLAQAVHGAADGLTKQSCRYSTAVQQADTACAKQWHTSGPFRAIKVAHARLDHRNAGGYASGSRRFFPPCKTPLLLLNSWTPPTSFRSMSRKRWWKFFSVGWSNTAAQELAKEIQDAEREYQAGGCRPVTPDELMGEVLS